MNNGTQKLFRFKNGYGASVVRHSFSYGTEKGLWELAVIKYIGIGIDDFSLTYDTPITADVIGYLSEIAVEKLLSKIKALPKAKK